MQLVRIYYAGGRPRKKKTTKPKSVAGQRKQPLERTLDEQKYIENEPEIEQTTSPEVAQTELYLNDEGPASELAKYWHDQQPVNYIHELLKLGVQTAPMSPIALKQRIPSSHLTNLLGKGVQAASFSPQTKTGAIVDKDALPRQPRVAIRKSAKTSVPARKTRQPLHRQDAENLKPGFELTETDYRPELHPAISGHERDNLQTVEDKQEQPPSELSQYYVPESHVSSTLPAISALEKITALQMIASSPAVSTAIALSHVNALSEKPSIFRPPTQATSRKIDFAPNSLTESREVRYPDEKSNELPSVTEFANLGSERTEATRINLPDFSYEKGQDLWSSLAFVTRAYPTILRSGLGRISGNRENDLSSDTQTIPAFEPPYANLPLQSSYPVMALIGNVVPSHSLLPVHSYLLVQRTENIPSQLPQRSLDYTTKSLMSVSRPLHIVSRIGEQANAPGPRQVPRTAFYIGEKGRKSEELAPNIDDSAKPAGAAADTYSGLSPMNYFQPSLFSGSVVGSAVSFLHMLPKFTDAASNVFPQNYLRSTSLDFPSKTGVERTSANESLLLKSTNEGSSPLTDSQIKNNTAGITNLLPYLMSSVSDKKILGLTSSRIDSMPGTFVGTTNTQMRRALRRIDPVPPAEAIRNDETGASFSSKSSAVLDKSPGLVDDKKEELEYPEKSDQHIERRLIQENTEDSIGGIEQKDIEIHHPGYVWPSLLYRLTDVASSFSREPSIQILEMIKSLPVNAYSIPSMARSIPMATHKTGTKSAVVSTAQDKSDLSPIYGLQNTLAASALPATSLPMNIFLERYAMTGAPRGIQQKRSGISKSPDSFKTSALHHNLPETSAYESVLDISNDYNPDGLNEFTFEEQSKAENKESESRELKRKIEEILNEEFRKYGFQL
jgi:hypothetical protein